MKQYITSEREELFEPNMAIGMVVSLTGNASEEQLRNAIVAAMQANEVFYTKIKLEDGEAWYEKNAQINENIHVTDQTWEELIATQEKIRFQIEQGEFLRAFLMPQTDGWKILLYAHHLVGDGKSLVYFTEDMMNALSGKQLVKKQLTLLPPKQLPRDSELRLLPKLMVSYLNKTWRRKGKAFSIEEQSKMQEKYWKESKTIVFTEHFSSDEVAKMKAASKEIGVGLTAYLTTAFYEQRSETLVTGFAVDGRMDHNRCMGNQVTGIDITYRYRSNYPFTYHAKQIQNRMKEKLSNSSTKYFILHFMGTLKGSLIDSIFMNLFGGYQNKFSQRVAKSFGFATQKRGLSITNLMKLDIPSEYGCYELKDYIFVPPVISYGKRVVGIVTLGNEMNITYHIRIAEQTNDEKQTNNEKQTFDEERYFKAVMKKLHIKSEREER